MFSSLARQTCMLSAKIVSPSAISLMKMSTSANFETLAVTIPQEYTYHVVLNRPDKLNSMSFKMFSEITECFSQLNTDPECRVVVLSANGKIFCAGLDLNDLMKSAPELAAINDVARKAKKIGGNVRRFQQTVSSLELCNKPVIAAIHSACVGGGFNLVTAADVRYCTKDAFFQLKEVDLGMAADIGALQRIPKVVGSDSLARELSYTARKVFADEAKSCGLVSNVFENKDSMLKAALDVAKQIASKSPVAVQTTKRNMVYSRDHTVQEGLEHIAMSNELMMQSEDFMNAVIAQMSKEEGKFDKL